MAAGQEFWLVATSVANEAEKTPLLQRLSQTPALNRSKKGEVWAMQVPDGESSGLTFGSFDNLVRLSDDLQKADSQVDGIVHRMERQWLEVEPKAEFKVKVRVPGNTQPYPMPFTQYIEAWKWDEAKYPKNRSIGDNLQHLLQTITRIDEEARNKTLAYNESKAQNANIMVKDGNLLSKDLVDVLTPETVGNLTGSHMDALVYSEYLTTVVVILPRGAERDFVAQYESFSPHVVPKSHKQFENLKDKDGNSVWRVVVMKEGAEEFKKACRDKRLVPRDFEYTTEGYSKIKEQREKVANATAQLLDRVRDLYQSVWSDAMVALMHIKAMRLFVESVLRYGLPPSFAAFAIAPTGGHPAARKALQDIIGAKGDHDHKAAGVGDEGEEYFPYVSYSFVPFNVPR